MVSTLKVKATDDRLEGSEFKADRSVIRRHQAQQSLTNKNLAKLDLSKPVMGQKEAKNSNKLEGCQNL